MRGSDTVAGSLFSYVGLEERVRADHPLRVICEVVNATLATLSPEFDVLCSLWGWASIAPERLLRAFGAAVASLAAAGVLLAAF